MVRTFVQTLIYSRLLDEKNISELQEMIEEEILKNLCVGDVIPGLGGLRKMRISDPGRRKGRRGGMRIVYLDVPKGEITYLIYLYGKDESENISSDVKKKILALVRTIKGE